MRRIVSVWLPDWPITVWSKVAGRAPPPENQPFALIDKGARGLAIHALNPAARRLGLAMGQAHADACAAVPQLISAPAELERDRKALRRLALWAGRFSPVVATDHVGQGLEGLMLDMTGGSHLFGGEETVLADLKQRLLRASIPARLSMADTPGAAWAMARFSGREQSRIPPSGAREALAGLPPAALRIPPEAVHLLARFGVRRISDLYALPRAGLARRFRDEAGLAVVERLDHALGVSFEPLTGERRAPRYLTSKIFAEPMTDGEGAAHWLPELAGALAAQMNKDGVGARRVRLTAYRMDGGVSAIEARLSAPSAKAAHLIRLLTTRGLERLDLGFGADALSLAAPRTEPLSARQSDLEQETLAETALTSLIDRLAARLGEEAVRQPVFQESWLLERAARWRQAGGGFSALPESRQPRPILTFEPPEPVEAIAELPDGAPARFTWRRVARKVVKSSGPERISPEWWRDPQARTRDYYRVEDEAGRRYWLFREGLYDGAENAERTPVWRIHGLFP